MKLTMRILFYILLLLLFTNCINKSESKNLPLSLAATKPYTPADIGLEPPPPALASLPVISDGERDAIYNALQEMNSMGMMTEEFLHKSSKAAYDSMKFQELTDDELDAKIDGELNGITYTPKPSPSNAAILARESAEGDAFFGRFTTDMPNLTNQQLIDTRIKLTVSLVVIRLQMDHNGPDGLPIEFYQMAKTKTVALRQQITEELIRRGVTSL